MAAEVTHLGQRIAELDVLRWWLLRELLEDAVRVLSEVSHLEPVVRPRTPGSLASWRTPRRQRPSRP